MSFVWRPGDSPPNIEEHSRAKLDVLRGYLRSYFDLLGGGFPRDEFRLDLVDGFSGGGLFSDQGGGVSGTPLVMLEEFESARIRLNEGRTKLMNFDCKFHFVDMEVLHTDYLRSVLAERDFGVDDGNVVVHTSPFESVVDEIIADIHRRQPRSGRAIFLLDQKGYSQVSLSIVARIFEKLRNAEVILTFSADALVNFLAENSRSIRSVEPLDITENQVHDWLQLKDGDGGKALVQRLLRGHLRSVTGADFDTPFFLRPQRSRRALWFVHLSRHPIARDVMVQCHWNHSNMFEHYGSGGLDMLGWDALRAGSVPLFNFSDLDAELMMRELPSSLLGELPVLLRGVSVEISQVRHLLANRTAARFSDMDQALLDLFVASEIDILNSDGRKRSRGIRKLSPSDRISFSREPMFPGWSPLA